MKDRSSIIFRLAIWLLKPLRRPYLWAKGKWPHYFEKHLQPSLNLDTSRMLRDFNFFHRLFFRRGFDTIRFNNAELEGLQAARRKGPVVFLMRNWGQVEYNYFNDLFLQKDLPLVVHNNMVKMGHWMPGPVWRPMVRNKIDRYFVDGDWPYNDKGFNLTQELQDARPVLFCLDFPKGAEWMEESEATQREIFQGLMDAQQVLSQPIQLVPLHFIYDKHPGRENSLTDIFFGERENPGYFRKVILFLRNYKKRAVAKIGDAVDLKEFVAVSPRASTAAALTRHLQRTFDIGARQVTGPKLKSRGAMVATILEDDPMRQKIRAFGDQHNLKFEAAEKKAAGYLREIASDIRFNVMQMWNVFLTWFFNSLYSGLVVDEAGINQIKKVAKDSPLVLVPCHKSHVDYMVLSYVFYHHDLSMPHICAGINLGFWPMGPIFRWSGAYFIRRSFDGDTLYPLALRSYVKELMREGYFQEFFIEGTRSRSGKLFPPKTGLLRMIVENFLEDNLKDVYFVPVSIVYERILEESGYVKEVKGAKKSKERVTDLFKLPRFLRKRYGKIYLQFGQPISLKKELQAGLPPEADDPAALNQFSKGLAHDIFVSINEVTTLIPSALVATVLLGHPGRSITYEQIQQGFDALLNLAKSGGARISENLAKNPVYSLEEVMTLFVHEGVVREHQDIDDRFFTVQDDVRSNLDFFKNQAMHYFVKPAFIQLSKGAIRSHPELGKIDLESWLRNLLAREFFISNDPSPAPPGAPSPARGEGIIKGAPSKKSGVESSKAFPSPLAGEGGRRPGEGSAPIPPWLYRTVQPILESYWLTLESLDRFPLEKIEDKTLTRKILEIGETLQLRGTLQFSESLSRFTVQNAVQTYTEMGILRNHQAEMGPAGRKYLSQGPQWEKRNEIKTMLKKLLNPQ